ncbi:MAG TPA: hypothetical protein VF142_17800, partial [Longimicrobium sp.]
MRRPAVPLLLCLLAACGAPARRPVPAPPPVAPPPAPVLPPAPPPIAQFQSVWTRDAGSQLRTDAGGVPL